MKSTLFFVITVCSFLCYAGKENAAPPVFRVSQKIGAVTYETNTSTVAEMQETLIKRTVVETKFMGKTVNNVGIPIYRNESRIVEEWFESDGQKPWATNSFVYTDESSPAVSATATQSYVQQVASPVYGGSGCYSAGTYSAGATVVPYAAYGYNDYGYMPYSYSRAAIYGGYGAYGGYANRYGFQCGIPQEYYWRPSVGISYRYSVGGRVGFRSRSTIGFGR